MKTDKRISLYLEGELTSEEKKSFEKELLNSPELQNELRLYSNFISSLEDTKNIHSDNNYFNNIVPEFRRRLENKKEKKILSENCICFPCISYSIFSFFLLV